MRAQTGGDAAGANHLGAHAMGHPDLSRSCVLIGCRVCAWWSWCHLALGTRRHKETIATLGNKRQPLGRTPSRLKPRVRLIR
jgi:hypothetical protein